MSRRQRYRELMRTLDPSGDPRAAVQMGWGVDRPTTATAERIARRIEIEPWSSHLIVGGIGSGKTTELWRIHQRLQAFGEETGDSSQYIDVAAETKLDRLSSGCLVALAATRLVELEADRRSARGGTEPSNEVRQAIAALRAFRRDLESEKRFFGTEEDWEQLVLDQASRLRVLQDASISEGAHCVVLFDSLDRISDIDRLQYALQVDLRAFEAARVGVVVVGPMRLGYRLPPEVADAFDQNLFVISDVEPVADGLDFLVDVLTRRVPADLMSPETCVEIARASGGVLRDLIALAKSAAQEAYVAGSDAVQPEHVVLAAEQFGRVRAVGLDGEQVQVLKKIRETGTLVIRGERELALLETRRVLDYGNGRFVVHPTLVRLLDAIMVAA